MTDDELLAFLRRELLAHTDEEFRRGAIRFFREPVDPYGVRAPEVKAIVRAVYRELKPWPAARRNRFTEELWKSGKFEEAGIAIETDRRFSKHFREPEFRLLERRLDRYVRNWAHCDGLSSWLLSAAVANDPGLVARLAAWTTSRNRWKRRASIVALLQEARRGRSTKQIFEIAEALLEDPDDLVRKGVGWVLKETYPKKPRELMAFLLPHAATTPRLVLRLAAEKMTAKDRAALLG